MNRWGLWLLILLLAALLRLVGLDRLPPGLSYDEAFNVLVASRLQTLMPPPVYIPAEFGVEPAHYVLIAVLYRLAGHSFAEAGRLASALSGVFTVGMLFFTAREMFRGSLGENQARRIGLLSAGTLAILYWHVHYSRLGMEPPMVPAFSVPAFFLFWLALNRKTANALGHWPWFALAGGALGLCLYAYAAGYLVPFVVVFYTAWRWSTTPRAFKSEWRGFLAYVIGALTVFAPHLAFYIEHPEWFMSRPSQVGISTTDVWYGLAQNTARMVGGLFWRGDTNLRLNLPGRPALDLVQAGALILGVWRGLRQPQRDGATFALIWLGVMLVPSIASDVSPHFGRALGATPPLAILVALGLEGFWSVSRQFAVRVPRLRARWLPGVASVLVVGGSFLYSGARTVNDYFKVWANDPGLFTAFEVGLRQSSEYLAGLPPEVILSLSPTPRDAPIFGFYLGSRGDQFKTFNGRRCTVFPYQPTSDFFHVALVGEEQRSLARLEEVFPTGQIAHKIFHQGVRQAAVYRVPAGTRAHLILEPMATFAGVIELAKPVGLMRQAFEPGKTLPVTLTWRALASPEINYTSFLHLAHQAGGPPLAQEDAQPCDNSYFTTWWSPGEIIEEMRLIHLPQDLPPGDYVLSAGWYDSNTGQRLPLKSGGDYIVLATIRYVSAPIQ